MNMSVDVNRWGGEEVWETIDAAFIIAGEEPNPSPHAVMTKKALAALSAIKSAYAIHRLTPIRATSTQVFFLAAELISWAAEKGFPLKPGLTDAVLASAAKYVAHHEETKAARLTKVPQNAPQNVSTDADTCAIAEMVMNGGPIVWDLWAHRTKIAPSDAAKLIFCIDPIRWPGSDCAQGAIDNELTYKIAMRAALLGDRSSHWSLSSLVDFLGDQDAPAGMQEAVRRSLASPTTHAVDHKPAAGARSASQPPGVRHKLRTNSLDAPIVKAIRLVGSLDTGAVFLQLRALALEEELPFTGVTEGDALCYTSDDGASKKLTKSALRKRLKGHSLPATEVHPSAVKSG